jgi:hypothetical protein
MRLVSLAAVVDMRLRAQTFQKGARLGCSFIRGYSFNLGSLRRGARKFFCPLCVFQIARDDRNLPININHLALYARNLPQLCKKRGSTLRAWAAWQYISGEENDNRQRFTILGIFGMLQI